MHSVVLSSICEYQVTDRCNMRCRYCMPREHFDENHEFLPKEDILRFEEIVRVVQALLPHGLRKVRLTGGEPLLRRNLSNWFANCELVLMNLTLPLQPMVSYSVSIWNHWLMLD